MGGRLLPRFQGCRERQRAAIGRICSPAARTTSDSFCLCLVFNVHGGDAKTSGISTDFIHSINTTCSGQLGNKPSRLPTRTSPEVGIHLHSHSTLLSATTGSFVHKPQKSTRTLEYFQPDHLHKLLEAASNMADCLPFPVVCIQCGRGVGWCGVKIVGQSTLHCLMRGLKQNSLLRLSLRLSLRRASDSPVSLGGRFEDAARSRTVLMLSATGPTIGFFFLVLSAFICWPIALLFCCFTEQGKK